MKHFNILKFICLLAFTFIVSCKAEKYDDPLASIYQTQWKGTFQSPQMNGIDIVVIAFESDSSGVCVYKDVAAKEIKSTFKYRQNDKVVSISFDDILNGIWWIQKLTRTELIMQTSPYVETRTQTLTLNRLY